jgi:hypothetical protein
MDEVLFQPSSSFRPVMDMHISLVRLPVALLDVPTLGPNRLPIDDLVYLVQRARQTTNTKQQGTISARAREQHKLILSRAIDEHDKHMRSEKHKRAEPTREHRS